jgi:flagellar hook-basal body complex protein FliE
MNTAMSGGLTGVQDFAEALNITGGTKTDSASVPFAGVMHSMIDQMNTLDEKATEAVVGLLNGQGVDIHTAMIATQKASLAFDLTLQVRNKAVAAYQQMMGMQF